MAHLKTMVLFAAPGFVETKNADSFLAQLEILAEFQRLGTAARGGQLFAWGLLGTKPSRSSGLALLEETKPCVWMPRCSNGGTCRETAINCLSGVLAKHCRWKHGCCLVWFVFPRIFCFLSFVSPRLRFLYPVGLLCLGVEESLPSLAFWLFS